MGDSWVIVRRETGENLNEGFSGKKKDFMKIICIYQKKVVSLHAKLRSMGKMPALRRKMNHLNQLKYDLQTYIFV